jgi:hypothetical protein
MERAKQMEDRCAYTSIVFYALTVGLGIAGFVMAAYGRTVPAVILGGCSLLSALLCFLTARASLRWRKAHAQS